MSTVRPWVFTEGEWRRRGLDDLPDYVPPPPVVALNPELPFELEPLRETMAASPHKVLPHYFVSFELGGDGGANTVDWYLRRLPGGSTREADGDWLLRDRPYDPWAATRPRTDVGGVSWRILDRAWQIEQAMAAGCDGFFPDWLNLNDGTGDNRTGQLRQLLDAVVHLGVQDRFKIALMIDGNTSISQAANLTGLVAKTVEFSIHPAVWRLPDGRLLVAVYMPEGAAVSTHQGTPEEVLAHWTAYRDGCAAAGVQVALWFCYQRGPWYGNATGQGLGATLDPIAYAHGRWGSRNPVETSNPNIQNAGAAAYCHTTFGKPFLNHVSPQSDRPNNDTYEEARGFEQMIESWRTTINGGADWAQVATWNDYTEGAMVDPSISGGWVWLDLCAYYGARWKLGYWPTIERDAIYLAHRIHPISGYTEQITVPDQTRHGSTPEVDIVQALVFLTSEVGTAMRVTVGGVTTEFTPSTGNAAFGGTGVHLLTVPLRTGAVSAEIVRSGVTVARVDSPHLVITTPLVQDMHYRAVSSLRQQLGSPA